MVNKVSTRTQYREFDILAFTHDDFGLPSDTPTMYIVGGIPGSLGARELQRLDRGAVEAGSLRNRTSIYTIWADGDRGAVASAPPVTAIPLYLLSFLTQSGGIPLFLDGFPELNETVPLFTMAGTSFATKTLFMPGGIHSSGICPLTIWGDIPASSTIPLYLLNIAGSTSSMNLYLNAREPARASGDFTLFTHGRNIGTQGGLYTSVNMVTYSDNGRSGIMPLYLGGWANPSDTTSSMNMFLKVLGNADGSVTQTNNIELFIKNAYVQQTGSIPLYMSAPVGTTGAIPISGGMPLFMQRQFDSIDIRTPLYINGPSTHNMALELFMQGQPNDRASADLFMEAKAQPYRKTNKLYTHGF